jgi:transposase
MYFEGLDAERAIAWRPADSFALREFLGLVMPEAPPDHSTISRTRRLIAVETHEAGFTWMLQRLADAGLVKGKTIGIDAMTLANAALGSIVRRDAGESYQDFLTKLAHASGDRDADARRPGADRLEATEERVERRLDPSP